MIIIANKPGQLCNRLFVYARLIAYAKEYKLKLLNPSLDEYAEFFVSTRKTLFNSYPKSNKEYFVPPMILRRFVFNLHYSLARIVAYLSILKPYLYCIYLDWGMKMNLDKKKLPDSYVVWLQGWGFHAPSLIQKHQEHIRNFFKPHDKYIHNIDKFLSKLDVEENNHFVGVHIRRGDYQNFEGGRYFYSIENYLSFLHQLYTLFAPHKIQFLICSNENLNQEDFEGLDVILGPGHIIEDLYLLAECDYIIGPPSTYSMWASFYGKVPLLQLKSTDQKVSKEDFKVCML